jgi:hypothetical protein
MNKIVCPLTLLLFLAALSQLVQSESDPIGQWCHNDVTNYDSYQSALDYVMSDALGLVELQQLIDDVLTRAGCQQLQVTSSTNITCSRVSLYSYFTPGTSAGEW